MGSIFELDSPIEYLDDTKSATDRIIESALSDEIEHLTARLTEVECELNEAAEALKVANMTNAVLTARLSAFMSANAILIDALNKRGGVQ